MILNDTQIVSDLGKLIANLPAPIRTHGESERRLNVITFRDGCLACSAVITASMSKSIASRDLRLTSSFPHRQLRA
jgi:hypothetical protein